MMQQTDSSFFIFFSFFFSREWFFRVYPSQKNKNIFLSCLFIIFWKDLFFMFFSKFFFFVQCPNIVYWPIVIKPSWQIMKQKVFLFISNSFWENSREKKRKFMASEKIKQKNCKSYEAISFCRFNPQKKNMKKWLRKVIWASFNCPFLWIYFNLKPF